MSVKLLELLWNMKNPWEWVLKAVVEDPQRKVFFKEPENVLSIKGVRCVEECQKPTANQETACVFGSWPINSRVSPNFGIISHLERLACPQLVFLNNLRYGTIYFACLKCSLYSVNPGQTKGQGNKYGTDPTLSGLSVWGWVTWYPYTAVNERKTGTKQNTTFENPSLQPEFSGQNATH